MSDVQEEVKAIKRLLKESVDRIMPSFQDIERNNPAGIFSIIGRQ